MDDVAFCGKWFVVRALDPPCNFFDFGAVADFRQEDGKFVSTESSEHIGAAELALHAVGNFLKVEVSDLVSVKIIHLFKVVEIDVDQTKDCGILTRLLDLALQISLQRKSIMNVGE